MVQCNQFVIPFDDSVHHNHYDSSPFNLCYIKFILLLNQLLVYKIMIEGDRCHESGGEGMRVIIEKLLLYIMLTGFYFADAEGASLVIALFAFILFFSMDLSGHRFIVPAATAIFTLSLLLGGGWIYYVPLLSFSVAGRYRKWAIATFIFHLAEPKISLIVLSGIVIYMVYLRDGMSALELENKQVRDQLTSDNLVLRRQH